VMAFWFHDMVQHGGPWDYQTMYGGEFGNFGNFNYGATGAALGWDLNTLSRMAGAAEMADHPDAPQPGDPGMLGPVPSPFSSGTPPYGDKPRDQYWIQQGFQYYQNQYGNRR
jgi:type VI secretion system secreted protein VgrG